MGPGKDQLGEIVFQIGEDEETGEIAFDSLDILGENLQAVELGGIFPADSGMSHELFLGNFASRACGVVFLHHLHVGVVEKEVFTLHQSHRMGVHLGERFDTLPGEGGEHMGDVHFLLSDDCHVAFAKQLVVLE